MEPFLHLQFDRIEVRGNRSLWSRLRTKLQPSEGFDKHCCARFFSRLFPILLWLPQYRVKEDLLGDVICGITVGIMNIPQGLAYGMLASLPPVHGLYVSFFPSLIYFMMGTSRHISIGVFAVMSIMAGNTINSVYHQVAIPPWLSESLASNNTTAAQMASMDPVRHYQKIVAAVTLTFWTGLFQILLGVFRCGRLNDYLSDAVVSGITTGAAIHVMTSQLKHVFGLSYVEPVGAFRLVKTYVIIFEDIGSSSGASIITSAICIFVTVLVKEQVNNRFKWKVPVPIELIMIVLATLVTYLGKLRENYHLEVVGHIPSGLPSPMLPDGHLMLSIAWEALVIALVCFAFNVSLARTFSAKHNYQINPNQELFAYGFANLFSSFFQCFVSTASLARSLVQEGTGGKTQIATLISCIIILLVLLFIGPLLEWLPNAVLAAIVLANLKTMLLKFKEMKLLWKISRMEILIWVVTFLVTVVVDLPIGFIAGIVICVLVTLSTLQRAEMTVLGRMPNTNIYLSVEDSRVHEIVNTKILRFETLLCYATCERFKSAVRGVVLGGGAANICHVVLDFSRVSAVDSMGVRAVVEIVNEMKKSNIVTSICQCRGDVFLVFTASGLLKDCGIETIEAAIEDSVNFYHTHAAPALVDDESSPYGTFAADAKDTI